MMIRFALVASACAAVTSARSLAHVKRTATATTAAASVATGKRGLAYTEASYTDYFALTGESTEVTWAYDWSDVSAGTINANLEFIPLLYNNDASLCSAWPSVASAAIASGSSALMSFNEPDLCASGSACMNLTVAVATYKEYMQPLAGQALLGAPAITNDGSSPGWPAGVDYLNYFIGNCTDCTIDFVAMHWYSNVYAGVTYLQEQVEAVRAVAGGRPIWVTEYGLDTTDAYTAQELQDFIEESMRYLDSQSDVHRYAYFLDAPGYLLDSAGSALSTNGALYNNYTVAEYGTIEVVNAIWADENVTQLVIENFLNNGVLVVDADDMSTTFGADPWWGELKTLNVLFTLLGEYYVLNVVQNAGSFTVTPASVYQSGRVTLLGSTAAPSATCDVIGAAWGNQTITSAGFEHSFCTAANAGAEVYFCDGFFGTNNAYDWLKSGAVYYWANGTFEILVGRDGDYLTPA